MRKQLTMLNVLWTLILSIFLLVSLLYLPWLLVSYAMFVSITFIGAHQNEIKQMLES